MASRGLSSQKANTERCQAFYAGDMMDYRAELQRGSAPVMVQFNKVKPYVNGVKGFLAQNRNKAKYVARIQQPTAQDLYSKYANSLHDYVRENNNADQIETQQDGDVLICGYGATETNMTYGLGQSTTDPNGEILKMRLDPNLVAWDPSSRQTNLLDSRFVYYPKEYYKDDAFELFDDNDLDHYDDGKPEEVYGELEYDENYDRLVRTYDDDLEWADKEEGTVRVYFYQWYEIEKFWRADNPIYTLTNPAAVSAAQLELEAIASEQEEDDMFSLDPRAEIISCDSKVKARLTEAFGDFITFVEFRRKVFYTAVVSKNHCFTAYRSPCQQGFSVKFKTGDFDERKKIWTGMVNSMIDPVMYYNKSLTELMYIIGSNSKGGVYVEKSAVENIRDFEANYTKTNAVITVQDGALAQGKIMPKKEPFSPSGYDQIIALSDAALTEVNGIDKTFLGSSENRMETATLQRQRIKQIFSSLACYVDSINLYLKEDARMMLDFMRIWADNNPGGVFRILGERGRQEWAAISGDKLAAEYDVSIQETPQTQEDRQEQASNLVVLGQQLAAMGNAKGAALAYALSLQYTTMDKEDIQQLMEVIVPQDDAIDPAMVLQLQQQVQMLSNQVMQSEVKAKEARAIKDMADAEKIQAQVAEVRASTAKTLEEAKRTSMETELAQRAGTSNVSVTI